MLREISSFIVTKLNLPPSQKHSRYYNFPKLSHHVRSQLLLLALFTKNSKAVHKTKSKKENVLSSILKQSIYYFLMFDHSMHMYNSQYSLNGPIVLLQAGLLLILRVKDHTLQEKSKIGSTFRFSTNPQTVGLQDYRQK